MNSAIEPFLPNILAALKANDVTEIQRIQTLWSGYGGIYRLALNGGARSTIIAKCIDLEQKGDHPRGWATSLSHQRKLKSYEVEDRWYSAYAHALDDDSKVAQLLYAEKRKGTQLLVLEDLSINYPELKSRCSLKEVFLVVDWLANFHAQFLGVQPEGLWEIGTYWHLGTRPDEWQVMKDSRLKRNAQAIDQALNNAQFKTIVHGDAKVANFCFANSAVAAVDFQYVGGGVGVKDLAYFMGSCLDEEECALYEEEILKHYFACLLKAVSLSNKDKQELEKEWRKLYVFAWADFNRFLLGWLPTHQKLHGFALAKNEQCLSLLD